MMQGCDDVISTMLMSRSISGLGPGELRIYTYPISRRLDVAHRVYQYHGGALHAAAGHIEADVRRSDARKAGGEGDEGEAGAPAREEAALREQQRAERGQALGAERRHRAAELGQRDPSRRRRRGRLSPLATG